MQNKIYIHDKAFDIVQFLNLHTSTPRTRSATSVSTYRTTQYHKPGARSLNNHHRSCVEEIRKMHKILVGKPEGNRHLEDLHVNGRIPLTRILKK
jgi:hypothetical protein